ncbi:MAG: pyridoxamine 5'-phosphate oxidase family protein [Solirubrobacteraceae bacterium]
MSRRGQIEMDDAEVAAFMKEERTVTCATIGPRGWPHLMPLWYVPRETPVGDSNPPTPRIWAWTYGASQKVRNLERDPRATLQIEAAEEYHELRGVMLECETVIHHELELVSELGAEILLRNSVPRGVEPPAGLPREAREAVAKQAVKRVGLEFVEHRRASWDHRKLGGVY